MRSSVRPEVSKCCSTSILVDSWSTDRLCVPVLTGGTGGAHVTVVAGGGGADEGTTLVPALHTPPSSPRAGGSSATSAGLSTGATGGTAEAESNAVVCTLSGGGVATSDERRRRDRCSVVAAWRRRVATIRCLRHSSRRDCLMDEENERQGVRDGVQPTHPRPNTKGQARPRVRIYHRRSCF